MSGNKVLIVAGYAESLVTFRGALIDSIISAGYEVHAAAPELESCPTVREKLLDKGVVLHSIPMRRTGVNPFVDIITLVSLVFLMLRIRPDVLLSYTIKPVIYSGLAAWITGISRRFSLITGLGYAFNKKRSSKYLFVNFIVQSLYRFSLQKSSLVFFQNPDDEQLFRKLGLVPAKVRSCVVAGSGINLADFPPAPLPETKSFLLIARLLGDKGVREYVQAAEVVKEKYSEISFKLVGWIDENPDAIKQSELDTWISNGTIEYLGKLSDVRPAIRDCSIYVLPSYREGTPRTVLEAMAMSRPIITTDAPGCRETVVDGVNGYLVPVKDVASLAKAMYKLIESPEKIAEMGAKSRMMASGKYDVHKVNAIMIEEMGLS